MRRITWVLAIIMSVALVLTGCGKKDAASVVKDLNSVSDKLESKQGAYQGSGTMTLYTGSSRRNTKWKCGTRIRPTTGSACLMSRRM